MTSFMTPNKLIIRAYKRIATDLSDPNNILPELTVDLSISAEEPSISQW